MVVVVRGANDEDWNHLVKGSKSLEKTDKLKTAVFLIETDIRLLFYVSSINEGRATTNTGSVVSCLYWTHKLTKQSGLFVLAANFKLTTPAQMTMELSNE